MTDRRMSISWSAIQALPCGHDHRSARDRPAVYRRGDPFMGNRRRHGGLGVLHGLSDSTLGLWLMHRRLLPGEMMKWYRAVVGPPLLVALPIVGLSRWLKPAGLGRWSVAAWIAATAFLAAASLLAVEWHRARSADRSASRALK